MIKIYPKRKKGNFMKFLIILFYFFSLELGVDLVSKKYLKQYKQKGKSV